MKKFFLFIAICSMLFVVACSEKSKSENKEENTGTSSDENSVVDADSTDTKPTETTPSDNEQIDTEVPDSDPNNQETDDLDTEYTAENCEIDDLFMVSDFSEYFTLKSTLLVNLSISENTTAKLYLENSDYSFDSESVQNQSEARTDIETMPEEFDDEKGLYIFSRFYKRPNGKKFLPVLEILAGIPDSRISSGVKEQNGKVTLESAPKIFVHSFEYSEDYDYYDSEEAWKKKCLVAINKNMLAGIQNGRTQFCQGKDDPREIEIGINAELTSKEADLFAYLNRNLTSDDPNYATSRENLCTVICAREGAEINEESGKCGCPEGTTLIMNESSEFTCRKLGQ